ncbi:hypothetical protein [uncultured Ruminococcus sp.]|nr:hypothetical protein [uncultured Ruminococcus sp.]
MKNTPKRKQRNKPGVVLFTAVAVMLMLSILLTATVSFVSVNRTKTNDNYKSKQAYLTASSTLESFINQIQTDTAPTNDPTAKAQQKKAIENLKKLASANSGKGTTTNVSYNGGNGKSDNIGTTTITVAQEGTSVANIVVTCETTYLGKTEQVAAHISTQSVTKPADYTNTIELVGNGNASYDNINVIGDMAGINNTTGKVYRFINDTQIYGSYLMYGSLEVTTQPKIYLKPSLVDETKGSTVTISENLTVSNEFKVWSTMARADGYNYINIGQKISTSNHFNIGDSGFEIDLFCSEANIGGNSITQYGNFYVYKGAGAYQGNATFGADSQNIYGSLYVEGDLNVTKALNVTGSIYVTGTITGKDNITCPNIKEGVVLSKAGRDAKPQIPVSADAYVYYPEDFFMSSDTNVTTISDEYQAFYNGKNTKTFNTFASDPSYWNNVDYTLTEPIDLTGTGAKTPVTSRYKLRITSSCTWASDLSFNDYGNGSRILVDVSDSSGDIVIRLQNGLNLGAEWSPVIVVRNRSTIIDTTTGDRKYNCYFVSDSGSAITLNGIDSVTGKSQHSGSSACNYSFKGLKVFDYDTYVRMFDSSVLNNTKGNPGLPQSGFVLNPTSVDVAGSYRPKNSSIIFLFGENTTLNATDQSFFQGSFYSPQAIVNIATSGLGGLVVTDSAGGKMTVQCCAVGVVIANSFGNANTAFYVYTKPSTTSVMQNAKGDKDDYAYGYELDRYDHY